jgi:methyltransferase
MIAYTVFVFLTGLERLWELRISRRNAALALAKGGKEYGFSHFPWMVALHTGLLFAAVAEVWIFQRPFLAVWGWVFVALALLAQVGRYWVISSLGEQWNTRVIVVPGAPRVRRGPYRYSWLSHPNYWIVAIEGIALPMIHSAWITALAFTVLNAILLLGFRIPTENRALAELS